MEVVFEGFKLWGPFAVFCVALMAFGWRVLNRRDDKLESLFMRGIADLREEMNSQYQRLKEEMDSQYQRLREEMDSQNQLLRQEMNSQYQLLREDTDSQISNLKVSIKQLEAQLLAYSEAHQADMETLIQKIDSSAQELRTEIRQLNQSHIRHLEHHIELDRRAEKK